MPPPEPPRRRQSATEIQGPDRRVDTVDYLEQRLREQQESKRAEQLRSDQRLAEALAANQDLKNRLGELALKEAAAVPVAVKTAPHWVGIVTAALVAALGGGGAGAGITRLVTASDQDIAPEMQKLRDRVYVGERGDSKRQEYLRERQDPEEQRWRLVLSWICKVNASQAFARGINCGDGIEWTTPQIKPKYFRTEESWPKFDPAP